MDVEITPEPSPEEREALLRALGALEVEAARPVAWWAAGIREATEDELETD